MQFTAKFIKSAASAAQFPPPGAPEVAFLGRSNVGKSSLINSLLGQKIARVSSTPGRTRTINFIGIHSSSKHPQPDLIFADLPGYGYAKISKSISAEWPKFIEPYLQERESLALCVCLVDANIPVRESDKNLVQWLQHHKKNFVIVATKTDRLPRSKIRDQLTALSAEFGSEIIPYSVETKAGFALLWSLIRGAASGEG